MLILQALKNRFIRVLWIGQLTSAVGDELFKITFIWMAVNTIGPNTGYITAAQLAAIVLVTFIGGRQIDRLHPIRVLLSMDLIRAILVLLPVIAFYKLKSYFWIALTSSVLISGLTGVFDPVFLSLLPTVAGSKRALQGATGLMSTTTRSARVFAPILIGLLSGVIPVVHFFTLDVSSFLISAVTIFLVTRSLTFIPHAEKETRASAWKLLAREPEFRRALILKGLTGGLWYLAYILGFAFLVKEEFGNRLGIYGTLMTAYGAGNLISALIFGSIERKHLELQVYLGFLVLAIGFILIGSVHWYPLLMVSSLFCALGGPLNDIPFFDLALHRFSQKEIPAMFRARTFFETACALLATLLAPYLFRVFHAKTIIFWSGILIAVGAGIGIFLTLESKRKRIEASI